MLQVDGVLLAGGRHHAKPSVCAGHRADRRGLGLPNGGAGRANVSAAGKQGSVQSIRKKQLIEMRGKKPMLCPTAECLVNVGNLEAERSIQQAVLL